MKVEIGYWIQRLGVRLILGVLLVGIGAIAPFGASASASRIDPYVARFFEATEPVALPYSSGSTSSPAADTQLFTAEEFSQGKHLFEENCINCHVGGITLPDPDVSLSLVALQNATPPRDTVLALMEFLRQPMTYDGQAETIWCRQISDTWMDDATLRTLAGFVLRAAQKAPAWGTSELF